MVLLLGKGDFGSWKPSSMLSIYVAMLNTYTAIVGCELLTPASDSSVPAPVLSWWKEVQNRFGPDAN